MILSCVTNENLEMRFFETMHYSNINANGYDKMGIEIDFDCYAFPFYDFTSIMCTFCFRLSSIVCMCP